MNRFRGVVLLVAAALAFWKGWRIHRGEMAVLAYGLGVLAVAMGAWHLIQAQRQPPAPRA